MNPSIQKDLFTLEKQERAMNLKFGVIYAKESQMTDDEFLSNQEGSKDFYNFLDLLGERINLKVGQNVAVIFRYILLNTFMIMTCFKIPWWIVFYI